jgi:hypothetical protein
MKVTVLSDVMKDDALNDRVARSASIIHSEICSNSVLVTVLRESLEMIDVEFNTLVTCCSSIMMVMMKRSYG